MKPIVIAVLLLAALAMKLNQVHYPQVTYDCTTDQYLSSNVTPQVECGGY